MPGTGSQAGISTLVHGVPELIEGESSLAEKDRLESCQALQFYTATSVEELRRANLLYPIGVFRKTLRLQGSCNSGTQ